MRSSGLILAVALILCIQLGSVFSKDIEGKWTNPNISPSAATSTSDRCCIPTSITIESRSMRLEARYEYSSSNQQCAQLFNNPDPTKNYLVVDKKYNQDAYSASALGVSFGVMVMLDEMFTYTGTESGLVIRNSGKNYYPCAFVMREFKSATPVGSIIFCLIVIGAIGFGVWKKYQQNILNKLAIEKANLNDSVDPAAAGYTAPNMHNPQQGFVQPVYYQQPMPQAQVQFQAQGYPQPMGMPQANVQFQAQGVPQANVQFQAQGSVQQPTGVPQAQVTVDVNAGPRPM